VAKPVHAREERRWPVSLRFRLAAWYGALLTVALVVFAAAILILDSDFINTTTDNTIRAETSVAMGAIQDELTPQPPYWPARLVLRPVTDYHQPAVGVLVSDASGRVLYRSNGSVMQILPPLDSLQAQASRGETVWATMQADGGRVRVEALPVRAQANTGEIIGTLVTVKSLADVDAALRELRTVLLLGGLGTLIAALAGGWLIATHVLLPISEISETARAVSAQSSRGMRIGGLSRRVPQPRANDELAQLVETFNTMLANLEHAIQTQHRFVADASHELRAPLTTIQGNLAFLQRHVEEIPAEERKTMLADAHTETLRLARLVDELLTLARADSARDSAEAALASARDSSGTHAQPVELDRELIQLVRQLRGRLTAEGNRVHVELGHIEPARVKGDAETLRRIAIILLDNAIKYTPAEKAETGPVVVSLERQGKDAILRVRDHGIGIEAEDLPHIFERFYRADKARSRQGTGLGLSIAATLVEQLGGRITAESTPGAGSTFSVWIPLQ